jgi:hypothetical protein
LFSTLARSQFSFFRVSSAVFFTVYFLPPPYSGAGNSVPDETVPGFAFVLVPEVLLQGWLLPGGRKKREKYIGNM